jgi:chromosome segregation ATPase
MRALYEERDSAFHSLELRLHELEADKTVLRGELKVAREMIEYEKAQRTEGMGKQAELMRKRDELEVDLIGARQDLSHRDDRITSLEAELVSANEEGAAIKRALEGYRGEVSELESKVEALERSKKEVEASEGEKSAKIIDLEEREREAMRNVEELIQEGKEKDGVNEMLSMEKVEFEQKILELEEKVKHDGSTIKLQEEKIEQLERSLGEILSVEEVVRTQLAASELDKDDAQKGTADLFHQLDQMKQSFEEAARELEESGAERTTLEKEKETLTVQLEVGRAMATAHEASLLTSADTIAKLSSKVSSAEQSAVSLQALLGQSQFESLSFKEQLTASLEQLKKVQERVMVEVGKREEVERRMSAVEGEFGEFKRKVGVMRKRQRQSWIEIDEDVDPTVTPILHG